METGLILFGAALASYVAWIRVRRLQSARLRRPTPATPETPVAGAPAAPAAGSRGMWQWVRDSFWVLLLVLIGVFVIVEIVTKAIPTPTPGEVGVLGKELWLWLLVLWGVTAALIALLVPNAAAKTLQKVAAAVAIALIVILPLWSRVSSPSTPPVVLPSVTSLPSAKLPKSEWLQVTVPAGGESDFIPRPPNQHIMMNSTGKFIHVAIYEGGRRCTYPDYCGPGSTGSVAKNLAEKPIVVALAVEHD